MLVDMKYMRIRNKLRDFILTSDKTIEVMSGLAGLYPEKNRNLRVYCVGTPRSGTSYIASIFKPEYKSQHEPIMSITVREIIRFLDEKISKKELKEELISRDNYLGLDVESAHYLHYISPLLASLFEESKFILTVRDPYDWVISQANKNYTTPDDIWWNKLNRKRFGNTKYKNKGEVFKLKSYIEYWKNHNKYVIENLPKDRLLIIDTYKIEQKLSKISSFLEIPRKKLSVNNVNKNTGSYEYDLRSKISEERIKSCISNICGPLIKSCDSLAPFAQYL